MNNVLDILIQEEIDIEVEKKVKDERIKRAKSLLDVLAIEIIAKKFELTIGEVEELREQASNE